ncbi:MAG TPA: isochorismatase family cysteine hydrolase [Gemmatimonadaceae bacterium]|nr:isochorismatase family cysteine hydrolase [Gemmatimonadaceae bacterium]
MPAKNKDLHGNVPDRARAALLIIDVINDMEFDRGAELLKRALPMARRLARLKRRAKEAGIPVIYANDNFGRWRSDFRRLLAHCLRDGVRGRPVAELLGPEPDDYFVLKAKHSGFYHTTLDLLLDYLGTETLILTGVATNICVLFTAGDAFMRDLRLHVPEDCVAASDLGAHRHALAQMREVLHADTTPSARLDLARLASEGGERDPRDGGAPRSAVGASRVGGRAPAPPAAKGRANGRRPRRSPARTRGAA